MHQANPSDTKVPLLDLDLSITNGIVSTKIYDKRDDFNLEIVNFPFLDGDVPRSPSYDAYVSQLIRFARVCSHVDDFNNRNTFLIEWEAKGGSYLTEVQWDISDLPFVRNKDFQNKVRHVRWGVFNSDCLYAKITLLSFITVC